MAKPHLDFLSRYGNLIESFKRAKISRKKFINSLRDFVAGSETSYGKCDSNMFDTKIRGLTALLHFSGTNIFT